MAFITKFSTLRNSEKIEIIIIFLLGLIATGVIGYSIGITIQSFLQLQITAKNIPTCTPNCSAGTNCGLNSDGCGGACMCPVGTKCNINNNQCETSQTPDSGCKPKCLIGRCGAADGCGAICDCRPDETCISGKCHKIPDHWNAFMYNKLKESIVSKNSELANKPSLVSCISNNIVDKYKNPQTLLGEDFTNSITEIIIGCKTKTIRDPGVPKFNRHSGHTGSSGPPGPPGPPPTDGKSIFNSCKNNSAFQANNCVSNILKCAAPRCLNNAACLYDVSSAAQNFCDETHTNGKGRPGNPGRSKHRPNSNPNQPIDDPNLVVSYCDNTTGQCSCVTTRLGDLRRTEKIHHTVFPGTTCDNGCGQGNCDTHLAAIGVH